MRDPLKEPKYGDVFVWTPPIDGTPSSSPKKVLYLTHGDLPDGPWVGLHLVYVLVYQAWFPLNHNPRRHSGSGYWTVAP